MTPILDVSLSIICAQFDGDVQIEIGKTWTNVGR